MSRSLLELFAEQPDGYISGEAISKKLNCSRTAIWKQIQSLRKQGYTFEAVPRLGYRLTGKPDRLDAALISANLATRVMGRAIHLYDSLESTQNAAHELVARGAPEGTLVIAEEQTAGRGRMGRSWHSPKGKGIWLSLLLKPRIALPFTPQLTLLAAVAVCRAIRQVAGIEVGIKWPNDLLVDGKKVCGILLESSAEDERLKYVIAGIGISANLAPEDYSEELRSKATSLLIESGHEVNRAELIEAILMQFEELYDLYHQAGFAPIRLLWEAFTVSLGRPIRTHTANGIITGVALAIDEMGALAIRKTGGEVIKLYSGEIEL